MSFEDELRSDLAGIRVPSAVSPPADLADTVLSRLRRQNRLRASVAAGAVVLAVAISGATAPVWLSPQPDPGPAAPTDPACGPQPTRPPSPTWEYFDPLRYEIDASGVTGYQVRGSVATAYYQAVELINPARDRTVGVLLYAAGGEPHYLGANDEAMPFDPAAGAPAGFVGGASAFWVSQHLVGVNTNEQALTWQWSPGAWAIVVAAEANVGADPTDPSASPTSTVDPAELRDTASQVAPQLELGVGTPVTSPFSMPVPNCTRLTLTATSQEIADGGEPYSVFVLGFDTADKADHTYPPGSDVQPSLLVTADTAAGPQAPAGTAFPGLGYPAYHDEGLLSVYEVAGYAVNVWPISMPDADTDAEKASLAADIFRTLTIYPGAAESEANWGDPIVP